MVVTSSKDDSCLLTCPPHGQAGPPVHSYPVSIESLDSSVEAIWASCADWREEEEEGERRRRGREKKREGKGKGE